MAQQIFRPQKGREIQDLTDQMNKIMTGALTITTVKNSGGGSNNLTDIETSIPLTAADRSPSFQVLASVQPSARLDSILIIKLIGGAGTDKLIITGTDTSDIIMSSDMIDLVTTIPVFQYIFTEYPSGQTLHFKYSGTDTSSGSIKIIVKVHI
jgi:hypothetical protein